METKIKVYAKAQNRLALGVIRAYTILNPEVTLTDIDAAFPHSLNPDSGVKENCIDVTTVNEKQGEKWNGYFVKDNELIALADGTQMTVVSMWTKPSLDRLLKKAADYGIEAEKVDQLPEQKDVLPGEEEPFSSKTKGYALEYVNGYKPEVFQSRLMLDMEQDIRDFFQKITTHPSEEKKNIFFNENDFQMHLSIYLTKLKDEEGNPKYDDVDIEYFVPIKELEGYDWGNKNGVNVNIVVEKNDEYVPIELKYATDTVNFNVKRFGEVLSKDEDIIKYQGAQNVVMYNFWKDVKRIEVLKKRFAKIKNGIALFLTNDVSYLTDPKEYAASAAFSTSNGKHPKEKHWKGEPALAKNKPDFDLSKDYTIAWNNLSIDGETFHYNLLEI